MRLSKPRRADVPLAAMALVCAALVAACSASTTSTAPPAKPPSPRATPSSTANLELYANAREAVQPRGDTSVREVRTADGRTRAYRLFVPSDLLGKAPLLLALHGGMGSGLQFEENSGFDGLATSNRFIVAYPDGVGRDEDGSRGARTWNGGDCCGTAAATGVDDVAFLLAVVQAVSKDHVVDHDRVYLTGHSNGAVMAIRLACEASTAFAAVGVQAGTLGLDSCAPARPLSLLQIHGTADTNMPIEGGRGSGLSDVDFAPPRSAAEAIAAANGCSATPTAPVDGANADLELQEWPGCQRGTSVQFLAVTGASHAWMGHPPVSRLSERFVGKPYANLDASRAIWSFLAGHRRT